MDLQQSHRPPDSRRAHRPDGGPTASCAVAVIMPFLERALLTLMPDRAPAAPAIVARVSNFAETVASPAVLDGAATGRKIERLKRGSWAAHEVFMAFAAGSMGEAALQAVDPRLEILRKTIHARRPQKSPSRRPGKRNSAS